MFAKIFRASPTGIAINNAETGKFIDVNDSFLNMFGYHRNEVIGHDSAELNLIDAEQREKKCNGDSGKRHDKK